MISEVLLIWAKFLDICMPKQVTDILKHILNKNNVCLCCDHNKRVMMTSTVTSVFFARAAEQSVVSASIPDLDFSNITYRAKGNCIVQ